MNPKTSSNSEIEPISKEHYFKPKEKGGLGYKREVIEIAKDQMATLDYPKPAKRYRLIQESFNMPVEEGYFWILNYMRNDLGMVNILKITDVFSASEHSSFFGVAQQRIGLQQDKVSQFLATIGKMVKELFQLVRELRIIDERMGFYNDSYTNSKSSGSAEITLKGIWVDVVEQATKNPGSVYGMARELQFTTLPDLFFSVAPKKPEDVDAAVDQLEFNENVKRVLKRKLRTYLQWKASTHDELKTKRKFTLKYLRQHYEIINMYMQFVKPYLKNLKRMNVEESRRDSPDLIAAFEGSMVEIEVLGYKRPEKNKDYYGCLMYTFTYRTRPSMNYQAEGYNRGPVHEGELQIDYRTYGWTKKDIENYQAMRRHEDLELLGVIDGSLKAAMEALGDELMNYLKEAGDDIKTPEDVKAPPMPSTAGPFSSLIGGFTELGSALLNLNPAGRGGEKKKSAPKKDPYKMDKEKKKAEKYVSGDLWISYKNYKKAHGMVTWH